MRENKNFIYMDNAATTMMNPRAAEEMSAYFCHLYGNPSSIYEFGNMGKERLDETRRIIADILNCDSDEIYFTSGGTESDNWAVRMAAQNYGDKGKHIITSAIEHHAVLNICRAMEKEGFDVTYLNPDGDGIVDIQKVREAVREDTILISIMTANNEIGTIQDINGIGKIAKENNILFHTDAVQAFTHIPIDVRECNISLLSASAHKFGGPKGMGFLYVDKSVKMSPMIYGGSQENGMRGGTGNVPGAVGMGTAARESYGNMRKNGIYMSRMRDYMADRVLNEIPQSTFNGHRSLRLPNNCNFSFERVGGESLVIMLDMEGICASGGSACTAGLDKSSHVLNAIGLPEGKAHGSLRLTISPDITKNDIDYTVDKLKIIIKKLRSVPT